MLQIRDLTITHTKDLRTIVKDFSFTLNPGDKAVILAEEGNGKSTLLKLIYSEDLVEDYVEYSGQIIKQNHKIGYLPQELQEQHKKLSVYEYCSQAPTFYEFTPKERSSIAQRLGLDHDLFYSEQLMGTLSGGEKVKIQFAKLLMEKPDVFLLDEPSNDIDIDTLEWLQEFIRSCEYPVLFVSHDEILIENTANIIIHLEQVKRKTEAKHTIARNRYKDYMKGRQNGIEKQEQLAVNERLAFNKQQEKFRKIKQRVDHEQNTISRQDPHGGQLLKKKMRAVTSMEKRFDKQYETLTEHPDYEEAIFIKFSEDIMIPNGKKIVEFHMDTLAIQDKILAKDIDLRIIGPKKICIIGKNGAGKTTLIKEIYKELQNRSDIKVAYMSQNYEELLDMHLTPVEYLSVSGDKEEYTKIRTYLGSMKYTADEMTHPISALSGGQKAKTLFLKMSMQGYHVLVLDEPTRNFSPLSNPVIRGILKEYRGCIISISHDRKYIDEVCDEVYQLDETGLTKIKEQ